MLPHSFLFGHLIEIGKVMVKRKLPPKCHTHWLPLLFLEEVPELAQKGILYLDVWPISQPLISLYHPDLIAQLTEGNFPKAKLMEMEFGPMTDNRDLLTMEGQDWKRARAVFNPGFSAKNLLSLVPEFVSEIQPFKQRLLAASKTNEVVKLEKWTTSMAIDVIGRAVLGTSLNSQTSSSPVVNTILAQIPLLYNQLDFYKLFNPIRYIKIWVYKRRFRRLLEPYVNEAVEGYQESATKSKTILRLALKEHMGERSSNSRVPSDFLEQSVPHFWMFIFAGHDTTAITLAFSFYMLSRNPDKAALLRAEHDRVLGPNPAEAAEKLTADPTLVNQLPYTIAIIKETLRLWAPVAGGVRITPPNHFLVHPDTGERFPTHGWMLNNNASCLQRLETYWPQPNAFIPERWLVGQDDPLYPRKGAYRPFEAGPRNCIGQELVSIEIRLVLALTVREFDVEDAYPADGPTFMGERAYSTEMPESVATAHAKDQMPVRIRARN